MTQSLYNLRGRDSADNVVWGCTVWANDAADARSIAERLIIQDRETGKREGLRPLPTVARITAVKGGSPANAVNFFLA